MKFRHGILVLLLLALAGCDSTTHEARRMVRRAEQLADTLPDSTVRLIDSVLRMPASFKESERMDMALLQAEALFGDRGQEISPVMDDDFFDDRPNLSTSPELERAADYYAGEKEYAKAAHAALYSGFVQQHYDEKEAAMQSFKEAEQYGNIIGDSLTMARAEYKMGKMLLDEYMKQDALDILKSAELGFGKNFAERSLAENLMAVCHLVLGDYENAEICLQNSLSFAENGHYSKLRLKALNNYAVLYQLKGDYTKALDCLKSTVDNLEISDTRRVLYYLNLGDLYVDKNEMDSAAFYYHLLESYLTDQNVKVQTKASAYGGFVAFHRTSRRQCHVIAILKGIRKECFGNTCES
ncbi:MAG: tetratricopeptide repeat protein [Bacteroidales bacterium]|nr:tetratricopeptide repeat protein [Bacteroidales bacterium]